MTNSITELLGELEQGMIVKYKSNGGVYRALLQKRVKFGAGVGPTHGWWLVSDPADESTYVIHEGWMLPESPLEQLARLAE